MNNNNLSSNGKNSPINANMSQLDLPTPPIGFRETQYWEISFWF